MRKLLIAFLGLTFALPISASAAFFDSGEFVSISDALEENSYIAGMYVDVESTVDGDLFVAGSSVSVDEPVNGDLFVAASQADIAGSAEDVRAVASLINIDGDIAGELLGTAGLISVSNDATVTGSAYLAAGEARLNGAFAGPVEVSAERVVLSGSFDGDMTVRAVDLVLEETAVVNGVITYKGENAAQITEGATVANEILFEESAYGKKMKHADKYADGFAEGLFGFMLTFKIISMIALVVTAIVLGLIAPKFITKLTDRTVKSFGKNILWGALYLIAVPAILLVLGLSVVGSGVAVLGGLAFAFTLIVGRVVALLFVGAWVVSAFQKKPKAVAKFAWWHALIGAAGFVILTLIPVLGWIVMFAIYLAAMGALIQLKGEMLKEWS
jgi:cytoskeletal protein CcmA (bactofilin family)